MNDTINYRLRLIICVTAIACGAQLSACSRQEIAAAAYQSLQQRTCLESSRDGTCPTHEPSYAVYD